MDGDKVIVVDVPFEKKQQAASSKRLGGEEEQEAASSERQEREEAARKDAAGVSGDEQKICWHVSGAGEICGRPAESGSDECMEHTLWDSVVPDGRVLPYPEDATSIHRILAYLLGRAILGQIDEKKLPWVLALCREIRLNLRAMRAEKLFARRVEGRKQ